MFICIVCPSVELIIVKNENCNTRYTKFVYIFPLQSALQILINSTHQIGIKLFRSGRCEASDRLEGEVRVPTRKHNERVRTGIVVWRNLDVVKVAYHHRE